MLQGETGPSRGAAKNIFKKFHLALDFSVSPCTVGLMKSQTKITATNADRYLEAQAKGFDQAAQHWQEKGQLLRAKTCADAAKLCRARIGQNGKL